jgi:hypothetical protein
MSLIGWVDAAVAAALTYVANTPAAAAAAAAGFQLARSLGWLFVPLGVAASLCLTSSGFVLQTRGFKHGSALVVCTTAAAASIVAGAPLLFF